MDMDTAMVKEKRTRKNHRKGRLKRWFRHHKRAFVPSFVLVFAVLSGTGAWMVWSQRQQESRQVTAGNSHDVGSGYRNITYNGKEYRFNNLVTAVLYAGIDSEGKMEPSRSYTSAARADSIALAVLDKKQKKMTVVGINRDTMTEIRRYSLSGGDRGTYVNHLGYAYTFGEGGKVSCENLREAVSHLFGGIPIDEYVVTNISSLPYINDLAGGITVQVPNDDLAALHPEMVKGASVKLDDTNVEDYIRYRDTAIDFSNEGRIERQKVYITEYVDVMKDLLQQDLNGTWEKISIMEDYLQTSITRNKYIGYANLLSEISFDESGFCYLEGEDRVGAYHDEFYVDQDALQELILELFYEEI